VSLYQHSKEQLVAGSGNFETVVQIPTLLTIAAILQPNEALFPQENLLLDENPFEKYQPPYTKESANELLDLHHAIALQYGAVSPEYLSTSYFKFTAQNDATVATPLISDHESENEVRMKGGAMRAFTALELAVVIHEQTRVYVEADTMGKEFPKGNLKAIQDLIAIMISGFDPQTYHMVAQHWNGYDFPTPVAGVRSTIGTSEEAIIKQQGNPHSNLSTLSALEITDPSIIPPELAGTQCTQVLCVGRYFKSNPAMEHYHMQVENKLAAVTLFYMGRLIGKVTTERELKKQEPLEWAIFDTHSLGVFALTRRSFQAKIVARGDATLVPTDAVSETVLVHHYGSKNPEEPQGYRQQIIWCCMSVSNFVNGSNKNLEK
jgi:hypothetical protein